MSGYIVLSGTNNKLSALQVNQDMLPVFLGLMLIASLAWIFLSKRLYRLMLEELPEIYKSLGSPKFIMRKSLQTNYRVMSFLLRKDYENTHNIKLIRLCEGLRYVLLIFAVCLSGCLILLAA